jgi:methyltransferase
MTWTIALLILVTLQRLGELVLAQANTRVLLAKGAREVAAGHYPLIVGLHLIWLLGLWLLASDAQINMLWLAVFIVLQLLRLWVIATLGSRWTTRIIVLPGETRIARGPYRWLDHPNYIVVIGEIAVLPLVFNLTSFALAASVANAMLLTVRISAEARALDEAEAFPPARGGRVQ